MPNSAIIFIVGVFVLAGFVKGAIGLGLPMISMGLLALFMPPVEAAAILTVPSLVTNVWQMLAGPRLGAVLQRLWPMMLGVCLGTWAGAGWMIGVFAIPAVPYLQAIRLEKEELVQALGLSFTVSTAALAFNLTAAGALNISLAGATIGALAMAAIGMGFGQAVRRAWQPDTFRLWFFAGLLVLGLYLVARALV